MISAKLACAIHLHAQRFKPDLTLAAHHRPQDSADKNGQLGPCE